MRRLPLAIAAISIALLAPALGAAAAGAETINFDNLNAPGPGSGDGLPVNVQYEEEEGVTFNEPSALDFSKGEDGIPGFAHSGTVAVEACVGAEFCKSPIEADFTAAQRSVQVWVGYDSSELSEPLGIRLTGYDGSTAVNTDDVTLPARSGHTPIQTPLAVETSSPQITKIALSVSSGEGFTGGLAMDDLEFSTAGPPPPCNANAVPTVVLEAPPQAFPQLNEFVLSGGVKKEGAPITSASVVDKAATNRTASAFPTLIGPGGGNFGPIRYDGLLSPGANEVVVTATNCRGTGTSNAVFLSQTPLEQGTKFHQLGMIEVSQSVQDSNNTVPLIAATPQGAKRTYARVYLSEEGSPAHVARVTGTLTAVRPDGSRPPGPISIPSLNEVVVQTGQTLEGARSNLANSLNFELPPEWQEAGKLHLELGHLEIESTQSNFFCEGCNNPGVGGPALVHFHSVPPMHIWLLSVPYVESKGAIPIVPRQFDFEMLASWLRRAYPSANIQISEETMPVQPEAPGELDKEGHRVRDGFLCNELNERINSFVSTTAAEEPHARFYGMVSDQEKHFMRGCSEIGGQVGSGPTGSKSWGWDFDGSYADWYGGHEIGHMFGRLHPGDCEQSDDDHSYPYPGGLIGDSAFDVQALDTGDATLGGSENKIPPQVGDWHTGWHDVMTYCEKEWLSDYTYRGILQNLCGNDHPQCPEHALLSDVGGPRPRRHKKSKRATLLLSGSLQLSSGHVSLNPMAVRRGLTLSTLPRKSAYAIELRGARGRPLARYPLEADELSDSPKPGEEMALFHAVVPFKAGTTQIAIVKGRRTLKAVHVSAHAPTVRITAPRKRAKAHGKLTLSWRGRDRDGGRRWYSVFYRPNAKRSIPIASDIRKTSLKVDLGQLPGGSHARFEVLASDGVLSGSARTPALRVPDKSPTVSIVSPAAGTVVPAGEAVGFQAAVTDPQDGQLPPAKIVWSSSAQGVLGDGQSTSAALSPGKHQVTVTATNSGGQSTVATVTVIAVTQPPVVQAEIEP